MPELPEVECFTRRLQERLPGRCVRSLRVTAPAMLEGLTPGACARAVTGRCVKRVTRHGKHLLVVFEQDTTLALHFGLSGEPRVLADGETAPPHTRLALVLDRGCLVVTDPRKLGRIAVAESPAAYLDAHGLGPDALGLSAVRLGALLEASRSGLKSFLMNQSVLAGIGNVYSDEILFQARLHPRRPAAGLSAGAVRRLHRCLDRVLATAIAAGADPDRMPGRFLIHYRHPGARCPRCGGALQRLTVGSRHAWLCPRCQPQAG